MEPHTPDFHIEVMLTGPQLHMLVFGGDERPLYDLMKVIGLSLDIVYLTL